MDSGFEKSITPPNGGFVSFPTMWEGFCFCQIEPDLVVYLHAGDEMEEQGDDREEGFARLTKYLPIP